MGPSLKLNIPTFKNHPHFLIAGIQIEFICDVMDWLQSQGLPLALVLPTSIRLGSIPGMQLMGQNPNTTIAVLHVYSNAPEAAWEGHRKAFSVWHHNIMAERQKAGSGLLKVTPGQARASGLDVQ